MEENCYVEPIYKTAVSAQQLQQADRATLTIWGMGCQNCVTRVRNSLLAMEGVYGVNVYLNMALAEVMYDSKLVLLNQLVEAVARAGNDGRHEYCAQLLATE